MCLTYRDDAECGQYTYSLISETHKGQSSTFYPNVVPCIKCAISRNVKPDIMTAKQYQQLTQDDVDHFMQHGWIKLTNCFTQEQADEMTANLWTRLGMSPTDKSTWHTERVNMPQHNQFAADKFAPKAWAGICDLLGGEERIADFNRTWNDGLIVNLGTPEGEGRDIPGEDLPGWHVDGDFFVHFLDSPEQGLLVIPLFSQIRPGGGGTYICEFD